MDKAANTQGLDYEAVKARQQATWASGDYGHIGVRLQIAGESICEAVDLRSTERVLDVAAGNGNAAIAAARRYADVTAVDYVPAFLEQAKRRADAEGLPLRILRTDVESLPFDDGEFDVVLSTFGVMFAPDHERAASELVRVARPGGRIGLASWTPGGFVGRLLGVIGRFVPPPTGILPPTSWGDEGYLAALFGSNVQRLLARVRQYTFRFASPDHWISVFRTHYGPLRKAFEALDGAAQGALEGALRELLAAHDQGGGRGLVVAGDYLEAVIELS